MAQNGDLPALPSQQKVGTAVGQEFPDATFATLDGEPVQISQLRGQHVIVNVWATWCPPCKAEMPLLQQTADEYAAEGVVVLGLNATAQDNLEGVAAFVADQGLTIPILLDTEDLLWTTYNVEYFPTSFFINPDGTIYHVVIGMVQETELPGLMDEWLDS